MSIDLMTPSSERLAIEKAIIAMERMTSARSWARPLGYPLSDADKIMAESLETLRAALSTQPLQATDKESLTDEWRPISDKQISEGQGGETC